MSPPLAANDVSPLRSEMMLLAIARNDAMFALMCPQAHIMREAHIIAAGNIFCPTGPFPKTRQARFGDPEGGQTSFKNASFGRQKMRF